MIPSKVELDVQGSLPGEAHRMTVDPAALTFLMKMMVDQYADKELAVIRELSTNARDSHVEADKEHVPIEVQTPSPLSPYLVITDYGVGLSEEEVYSLFGRYGASTKRNSNRFNGMYGLGSKSPLAYTNQFTMTATKDGQQSVVSISRDEDGVGNLQTVAVVRTDEPNGVSVKIPAKTGNQIEAKVKNFFKYWEAGTVLVNGEQPAGLAEAILVADRIKVADKDGNVSVVPCPIRMVKGDRYSGNASIVVMGNVPYPAGDGLTAQAMGMPHGYAVVAEVPIGAVEFGASREQLDTGAKTTRVLDAIAKEARDGFAKAIQDEVTAAKGPREALTIYLGWRQALHHTMAAKLTWNGKPFPTQIAPPKGTKKDGYGYSREVYMGDIYSLTPGYDTGRQRVGNMHYVDIQYALDNIFVVNFPYGGITPTHKKKLAQYNGKLSKPSNQRYLVCNFDLSPFKPYMAPDQVIDWSVIEAEKLPKQTVGSTGRIPGSFDVVFGGENRADGNPSGLNKYGLPGDKLDQTKPLYWLHGNIREAARYVSVLDKIDPEYTIICLSENRIQKFNRENPTIQNVKSVIKAKMQALVDGLSDNEKLAVHLKDNYVLTDFQAISRRGQAILDPDVQKAARASMTNVKKVLAARESFRAEAQWPEVKWENPLHKYLLWDERTFQRHPDHVIHYMNGELDRMTNA